MKHQSRQGGRLFRLDAVPLVGMLQGWSRWIHSEPRTVEEVPARLLRVGTGLSQRYGEVAWRVREIQALTVRGMRRGLDCAFQSAGVRGEDRGSMPAECRSSPQPERAYSEHGCFILS